MEVNLSGKKGMFLGVRDWRSITTACMMRAYRSGMEVAIVCQKITPEIKEIARECHAAAVVECNVLNEKEYAPAFRQITDTFGGQVDAILHGIAFAPHRLLSGVLNARPGDTEKMGDFEKMMAVSVGSLLYAVQCVREALRPGSSIITLSYEGAVRYVPGYNGMDTAKAALESLVRALSVELAGTSTVNAISAGPVDTTAAEGIPGFQGIRQDTLDHAPLHRLPTKDEIAGMALYLMSHPARAITGQSLCVDCGRSAVQ